MKTIFLSILFIAGTLIVPTGARAQLRLSLQQAIDSALRNNDKIKQSREAVFEKEYLNKAALANYFPQVSLNAGYTFMSRNPEVNMSQVKESVDDVAGKYGAVIASELGLSGESQEAIYNTIVNSLGKLPAYNIVVDQQHYPNLNISALQPIFTGGKINAGKNAAGAEYRLSQIELENETNKIIKEVTVRYLQVVLLKEVVNTRQEVVDGIKRHEKQAKRAVEIGMIPPHELLRVQVAVANAERERDDDMNKLELATLALKTLMGMDENIRIEPADSLIYKLADLPLDSLTASARQNQPVFKMIEQKKLLAEQKYNFERSKFMPQIAAFGQWGLFREQYPVIMPPFILGIQLEMKLFNGTKGINTFKSAKHLQMQVKYAEEYAGKEVRLWVNKAYTDVLNYQDRYGKLKPTVQLAKKNLEINEKRFREGVGKSIDVIDAEMLYSGAKTERLHSLYGYYKALAELYFAIGNPGKVVEILTK